MSLLPNQSEHGQWGKRGCSIVPGVPQFISEATELGAVGTSFCKVHNLLE